MADPTDRPETSWEGSVRAIEGRDPGSALSLLQNFPGSVRVIVLVADSREGSWAGGGDLRDIVLAVQKVVIPVILLVSGNGGVKGELAEACDLSFFDEDVTVSTEKGILSARDAERGGMINFAGSRDEARRKALETAGSIARLAPLAVRAAKRAVRSAAAFDLEKGLELENRLFADLFGSGDMKEGTLAFLEKRVPDFLGE